MGVTNLPTQSDALRLGARGPVLVVVFYSWPNASLLRSVSEAQGGLAAQFGKVAMLYVVPNPAQVPEVRAEAAPSREKWLDESKREGARMQASTAANALVILPKGLLAVMIRSFVTLATLASRSTAPLETFRDLDAAASWLEAQEGLGITGGLGRDL
jgi:hypothetical protein